MKTRRTFVPTIVATMVAALLVLSIVGCTAMPDVVAAEIARSDLDRELAPQVAQEDLYQVAADNRAFALNLPQVHA